MAADCIPSCLLFYHKEIWNSSRKNCPSVRRGVEKMKSAYIYISNVADDAWESRSQYGHGGATKRTMDYHSKGIKGLFLRHPCLLFVYILKSRVEDIAIWENLYIILSQPWIIYVPRCPLVLPTCTLLGHVITPSVYIYT